MNKHTATLMMTTLALACAQAFADEPAFEQPKAADYVPSGSRAAAEDKAAQTQEEGGNLPLKYPVEIRTDNSEVKAMLQEYLPLITQQQQEVLDREQVGFLAEDAPDNVQTMLRTKGYFNGRVTVSPAGEGYVVAVAPGPQTKIENVGVAILGTFRCR